MLVSHALTYLVLSAGTGSEMNPMASATLWMPPMLNLGLWEGGMVGLMVFLHGRFDRNRELVLSLLIPLCLLTAMDATNDVMVAVRVGLFR